MVLTAPVALCSSDLMRRVSRIVAAVVMVLGLAASGWDSCTCCASASTRVQAHGHACCASKMPMMRAAQSSCQCLAEQGQAPIMELASVAPEAAVLPAALIGIGDAAVCGFVTCRVGRVAVSPSPPPTILRI